MLNNEAKLKSIEEEYTYTLKGRGITIVEYIGNSQKVIIPETIENKPVTKIAAEAFEGKNLVEVYMPNTIKEIGKYAFASNMYLTKIELSSNLKSIPEGMLAFCNKLKELTIPDSAISIGKNSLDYVKLRKLVIPNSVKKLSNKTFGKKLCEMKSITFIGEKGSVAEEILLSNDLNFITE
ncbi:MAG: leucine-rich repeat domain-containing protein [Terrisporobacter sp.]